MLVKYNKVNCLHVPLSVSDGKDTHKTVSPVQVSFVPGVNSVKDTDWKKCAAHPTVKAMMEDGDIEVIESKSGSDSDKKDGAPDLKDMNAKDAIKAVKATANPDLLEDWKKLESRETVKKAIVDQLDKIDEMTTPDPK